MLLQLENDSRTTVSFIHSLSTDQKIDTLAERLNEVASKLEQTHTLINAAWALTPAQEV